MKTWFVSPFLGKRNVFHMLAMPKSKHLVYEHYLIFIFLYIARIYQNLMCKPLKQNWIPHMLRKAVCADPTGIEVRTAKHELGKTSAINSK